MVSITTPVPQRGRKNHGTSYISDCGRVKLKVVEQLVNYLHSMFSFRMPKSKELVSSSSSGSDSDSEVDKKVTIPGPSRFCIPSSAELFIARSKGE